MQNCHWSPEEKRCVIQTLFKSKDIDFDCTKTNKTCGLKDTPGCLILKEDVFNDICYHSILLKFKLFCEDFK